ncbi:hypothetical protein LOCC1_G002529 [Lachnellula occidentalis]|uniref:N-acetyltransferase domain-containing protein n=1 Tax=Lachnellula occidentalis TaxID=215460 RepID=A0A8H8S3T3_9HELO|nr:hypothetical protein LOCC1_G002529 [Lachnellula occidentalis]
MSYIYKIHHLPTSDPTLLAFLAGKFASLRLTALSVSAAAFSSTFAIESTFTASQWISRLQRPEIHTFIAVAYSPNTKPEQQTIDAGDWIGSATLLGPTPKAVYDIPESGGPEIGGDDVESKWQMCAVYNNPEHRGKGIAKLSINGAIEHSAKEAGGRQSRVRIMIHHDNILVKKLYDGLGFVDAGHCTLSEAFLANGDSGLLPADKGASQPEKYDVRLGVIMMKVASFDDLR